MSIKKFILKLAGITIGIALLGWLAFSFFLTEYYLPVLPFLLLFFFVITILIHAYQINLAKKDIGKFARSNMLITFFKLILYSIVAVIYIAFDTENAIVFVICLMLLYLVYTFVEVSEISGTVKTNQKK
ncbi:MAG: hypothetical protein HQ522_17710 [Bacteroidetes bacterium]|nr:hypothetical protein [Bacteroidota bacterium]